MPDVIPPTERNQDPLRTEQSRDLTTGSVEPKPEDRAETVAERVYAPASERIPKEPVPGHREVIEHTDTHTPEREAVASSDNGNGNGEPSFTRVPRPSTQPISTTEAAYSSPSSNPGLIPEEPPEGRGARQKMFLGIGFSWLTVIGCAVGVWLFMRWRAERNKPINRLRRQALHAWQTADEWRGRMPMPSREEAARPAAGLGSVMLPLLIVLWRQSQARSRQEEMVGRGERFGRQADRAARQAAQRISEADWQQRLTQLKQRWNPSRLELEKIQISRH